MRCLHATRLVFVACMLAAACAGAAPPSLPATTFTALDTRAGLPAPDVFAIAQDAEGFMWFATVSGLARFDGMEMKVYRHREGDAGKLVDDEVGALFRDRQDRLWAATNAGLCRVRAPSDDFDCTRGEQGELAGLRTLAQSGDGALWMGGDGLVRFDPATGATRHYPLPEGGEQALDRLVLQVLIDTRGRTWVGSLRHGLFRFDAGTGNFTPVVLGPITKAKTTAHAAVRSVYEDRKARIWVGTDGGLTRLDGEGRLEAFYDYNEQDPGDPRSLSDNYVDSIFEDRDGNLWIGTHTRGINRYVPAADCFRRYRLREQRTLETDDDPVYAMFQDATGLLWFAGKGLHRLDLDSERLLRHKPPRGDPGEGSVANPEQLMVDAAGVVFIGGGAGLVRYDPAHEEWARHLLFPHDTHFANNRPSALLAGTDEFRYVAGPGGIWLYREDKRDFGESFLTNPGRPTALLIDRANVLWAATSAHGLVRYGAAGEPDQTVYRHDPANTATLSSGFEYFLHEDAHGRFWVGTATGLDLLDRGSGSVHRFPYDPRDPHGPPHREFRAVAESAEGTLWFGTGRGITRLDAAAQRFQSWSVRDGLPHDRVNALTVDRGGALWIGTDAGLARFDPATQGFHNLFREQGLPSDRVRRLALAPDGRLFIATDSGLVSLDPGEFAQPPVAPQVGIAGLRLQGEPMPLDRVESSDRITLKHADDVLGIDLAVFDFRDPARNHLAWRLDGIDADWVHADGAQRHANYTTLPPGDYRFRYRGRGTSGSWQEGQRVLHLSVLPAPWLTAWALSSYVLLLLLAVYGFVRLRTRSALQRARVLEIQVGERTHELQQQRDRIAQQGDRLRQAIEAKDRLYANVSHEFRTPLTVILGPLERLLWDEQAPKRRQHLEIVRRNAQRLLRLVEQIMTLARIDAQRTKAPQVLRMTTVVNTLVQSFATLADDKRIALGFRSDIAGWIHCDRDALERIAINLISNAIKYTPPDGRVEVAVEAAASDRVDLVVRDTGVGIAAHEQAAVFERFYRAGDQQEAVAGTGLGLALVKELSAANDAQVELHSVVGEGTTVRVAFPRAEAPAGEPAEPGVEDAESKLAELEAASARAYDDLQTIDQRKSAVQNILVIEDNADLCWHLAQVLGEQFQCSFARDGESGVEQALEAIPDLVICDVMLPKLNGFEVTRRIKEDERTSHVPVILLTARADEDSRIAGLRALADEYVTKPFSENELRQRVDTLLSIREILRERFARETRRLTLGDLPEELGLRDRRFLERVEHALAAHYADAEFSMVEFASLVAMSERQMQRKLKALTNQAPREYLRSYRLERAVELLKAGEPAGSVAFSVGFSSQSYFTNCFKAEYGVTPGQLSGRDHSESSG